jgi:hypothetical protein
MSSLKFQILDSTSDYSLCMMVAVGLLLWPHDAREEWLCEIHQSKTGTRKRQRLQHSA